MTRDAMRHDFTWQGVSCVHDPGDDILDQGAGSQDGQARGRVKGRLLFT